MTRELIYLEDAQGFLFRLLRQGYDRWPQPHCMTQQDYLCLKLLQANDLGGKEMQHLREALADPSLRYLSVPGAKHINVQRLREAHRLIVLQALRTGQYVPDEVLDAYLSWREFVVQELPDGCAQVGLYGETLTLSQEALALFHQVSDELATCGAFYQSQADPYPEPRQLRVLKNPGSEIERIWCVFNQHYQEIRPRLLSNDPLWQVMRRLIDNEIYRLTTWFQIHGYDEAHIPASPSLDHTTMHERPGGWGLKNAVFLGQIGCCGWEHPEQGGVTVFLNTPGYIIAYWNALQLWPRHTLWTHQKTEEVWAIAREMSHMTNWEVVFEQPRKVQRAILAKLRSLVEPNQGMLEEDSVKRFQL